MLSVTLLSMYIYVQVYIVPTTTLPQHSAPHHMRNNQTESWCGASQSVNCRRYMVSFDAHPPFQDFSSRNRLSRERINKKKSSNGDCYKHHRTVMFQDIQFAYILLCLYDRPAAYVRSGSR